MVIATLLVLLQCSGCALKRSFVRLTVDPHRIQPLVTEPCRYGGQVDLHQTPGRGVAETMRMHIRDLCAPAEFGDQVLNAAPLLAWKLAKDPRSWAACGLGSFVVPFQDDKPDRTEIVGFTIKTSIPQVPVPICRSIILSL